MTHITPTPGRIVWYTPAADDGISKGADPLAAIVAGVNEDGTVNLAVFGHNAQPAVRMYVTLVQDGEDAPDTGYAQWMPYQLGQAAKAAAAAATEEDGK